MTVPAAALERLLTSVCASPDSDAFVGDWGEASAGFGRRLRIVEPRDDAFARLEVKPWDAESGGGVEVTFSDGAAPTLAELDAWLGGLEELAPLPSGDFLHRAEWSRPGLPVVAIVVVEEPDDPAGPVRGLSVRRAHWAPVDA